MNPSRAVARKGVKINTLLEILMGWGSPIVNTVFLTPFKVRIGTYTSSFLLLLNEYVKLEGMRLRLVNILIILLIM